MSDARRQLIGGLLLRLVGFYAAVGLGIAALIRFVPGAGDVIGTDLDVSAPALDTLQQAFERSVPATRGYSWLDGVVAMLGALLFALPVAWTYRVTKRGETYDRSLVQMIVLLPTVVAAVVLVVFRNLALAFALAGIVAAVRFRTTFKDVRDAVFAFVAIGIGLASGAQSWMLAGMLSAFFSVLALVTWRMELRESSPAPSRRRGPPLLSEALMPGDDEPAVAMGEGDLIAPLTEDERKVVGERVDRLAQYMKADALEPSKNYRHLLLAYVADDEEGVSFVEDLLDDTAKRWRRVDSFPGRDGTTVLAYLIRLRKKVEIADVLDRLLSEGEDTVRAAEIKSVKSFGGKSRGEP